MIQPQQLSAEWENWINNQIKQKTSLENITEIMIQKNIDLETIDHYLNLHHKTFQKVVESLSFFNATMLMDKPVRIYTIDNFLSSFECEHTVSLIKNNHYTSKTIIKNKEVQDENRKSKSSDLELLNNTTIKSIQQKIFGLMGINASFSSPIQGQMYETKGFYKPHYDSFEISPNNATIKGRQRTWTVIIYLNDVEDGGGTYFPKCDITIQPQQGRLICWYNLDKNSHVIPASLHGSEKVIKGEKFIITQWFNQFPRR